MFNNAINAYQTIQNEGLSDRETEARVLTQAARKLIVCQREWTQPNLRERLGDALQYNQRIWTIFQTEMLEETNPLPPEIKRNILKLSQLVDRRTMDTLTEPEPEKLDLLIRINENVAAGLRGSVTGPVGGE